MNVPRTPLTEQPGYPSVSSWGDSALVGGIGPEGQQ